jgi:hypothetical protein
MTRPRRVPPDSKGCKPDKLVRGAIIIALKREAVDADGAPTQRLTLIAEKLVEKAMAGGIHAIKEIADRRGWQGRAAAPMIKPHRISYSRVSKVIWDSTTHDLILRTVLALCWLIIALFRPPALLSFLPLRFQEIFFAEKKTLSRLLLLWGVGLFLLSDYLSYGLDRLGYRSDIVRLPLRLMFGAGLGLIFLALATYIWAEVRKRRDSGE